MKQRFDLKEIINGKKVAWSIIFLILFIYMIFHDFNIKGFIDNLFLLLLTLFFAWRFIENTEDVFK